MWNWLLHEIGVRPVSGSGAYAFWSGFGSDLGEVTILGALIGTYRHHNCHVKGCIRLGKHLYEMNGAQYKLCPKHHPAVDGATPVTSEAITQHHASKKVTRVRKQA